MARNTLSRICQVFLADHFSLDRYPNPAETDVIMNTKVTKGELVLTDVAGKHLWNSKVSSQQTKRNVDNFAKGIYVIMLTSTFEKFSEKLIVE